MYSKINKIKSKVLYVAGITESELAPIINDFISNRNNLYIKSHPKGISNGVYHIELVISFQSNDFSDSLINSTIKDLITSIKIKTNITVDE